MLLGTSDLSDIDSDIDETILDDVDALDSTVIRDDDNTDILTSMDTPKVIPPCNRPKMVAKL